MNMPIRIGKVDIGPEHPVFIIAEAGVNHNGDLELARRLVHAAKKVGASCIKFQTFKAGRLVTQEAPKADYQIRSTNPDESQLEMLKALELTPEDHVELIAVCKSEDLIFLSTPYNIEDIDFLDELGVPAFKVASGQAVEPNFLVHMAKKGKPIILSTGMCTLAEVDEAVRIIRSAGNHQLVVLQCTTNYPSALEDCNLKAMMTMATALNTPVGYSDHAQGHTAAMTAVALGACIIERHFTLDKELPGPDHTSSSDPDEFSQLVRHIRDVEVCLGSPLKVPTDIEQKNVVGIRRSLVAKIDIPVGTILNWVNLTFKRPATGLTANYAELVIGHKASRHIHAGEMVSLDMIQ